MRRLVVLTLAAVVTLTLSGCGGGGGSSTTSTPSGTNSAAAPSAAAPSAPSKGSGSTGVIPDRSAPASQKYTPLPSDSSVVPTTVADEVEAKQPMLLFFYDSTQKSSAAQRAQIDNAIKPYRGLIDVIGYNVAKYVTNDGAVVYIDPALARNAAQKKVVSFANVLGVNFTPFVIITDKNGYVVWRGRGYQDAKLLQQQIMRATQ